MGATIIANKFWTFVTWREIIYMRPEKIILLPTELLTLTIRCEFTYKGENKLLNSAKRWPIRA
jgi:hypothetical protein